MKVTRRKLLRIFAFSAGAIGTAAPVLLGARRSFAAPAHRNTMHLGSVTYNLAKDWDIETIIKNCEEAKFEGVELRTTHAHGVEVTLNAGERERVRKRFANSPVKLMGLGSAFDYH